MLRRLEGKWRVQNLAKEWLPANPCLTFVSTPAFNVFWYDELAHLLHSPCTCKTSSGLFIKFVGRWANQLCTQKHQDGWQVIMQKKRTVFSHGSVQVKWPRLRYCYFSHGMITGPVIYSLFAFQLVRSASFSRGGQLSFTNLDFPSSSHFQASFGFQTFQPSGILLSHQTGVWNIVWMLNMI